MSDRNDVLRSAAGISDEFLLRGSREALVLTLRGLRAGAMAALEPRQPAMSAIKLQVLELMVRGNTNKQIGQVMSRTEKTIKAHVTGILKVTGCKSRSQLLVKYYDNALCVTVSGGCHAS